MRKRCIHLRRKEAKLKEKSLSNKWKKRTKVSRGYIAWRLLKGVIFFVCLTLFFYQSATFLEVYYTYPTTAKIEFTSPKEFEFPAVTFCNFNPIKRSKFCSEYPDLCQSPVNITEACEIVPSACKHNPLDLVIPKIGFLANNSRNDVRNAMFEIYYSGNVTKEFWEEWVWSIRTRREMKPAFIPSPLYQRYFPCFVENLLFNSTDEPKKMNLDYVRHMGTFDLKLPRSEEINFGREPSVFLSIHSPFVPVDLFQDGSVLELGHNYNIYIKLEEKILLPFPYAADCIIYEDSWNEGNPHRPRSQEMCKQLCLHSLFKGYKNITLEFTMLEYPIELCFGPNCTTSEGNEILEQCWSDCKPSCRNLKYTSTITETSLDKPKRKHIRDPDSERDKIQVKIFLADRQVVVNHHVAVYDTGHLFSYIGGLMGCWLGISISAFAGIAENIVRRALQWIEKIKRYLKNTFQAPHRVFVPHRNNVLKIKNF